MAAITLFSMAEWSSILPPKTVRPELKYRIFNEEELQIISPSLFFTLSLTLSLSYSLSLLLSHSLTLSLLLSHSITLLLSLLLSLIPS